jgi:transcriptional regulator with XRE-family HTH domain
MSTRGYTDSVSVKPSEGIGRRLAQYRRLSGLSAQELSDKIGGMLSRSVIANIENGRKTDLTVDQLIALSWALDVPPVALALPLDEPYRFIRIVDSEDVLVAERAFFSVMWFIDQGELPMTTAQRHRSSPGRVLAKTIVRNLAKYAWAQRESRTGMDESQKAEATEEFAAIASDLESLGVNTSNFKIDD